MPPQHSKQTRLNSGLATTSLRVFALTGLLVALHADCMALRVALAKDGLAPEREVLVDFYGDALPNGAVARMGTPRFRIGSKITTIAFSPDGKTLTAASDSSTPFVPIWDAKTGRVIRVLAAPSDRQPKEGEGEERDVAVARVGNLMATLYGDDTAQIWEPATGRLVREFQLLGDDHLFRIRVGVDGATLFSIGGKVALWNVRTGEVVRRFAVAAGVASPMQVALSRDGSLLAAAYGDQRIRLWDVASGKLVQEIGDSGLIFPNAFSPDGKSLTSVRRDGIIKTWGASNGNLLSSNALASGIIAGAICLSPDSTLVAAGCSDATIGLARVSTGAEVLRIRPEPREVPYALAFSPDAKTIASASGECAVVQLWDATTGKEISPYHRHNGRVYAVAFSPDDRSLASAGCDGSLRLWEVMTGRPIRAILDAPLRVRDAANEAAVQRTLLSRIGSLGSIAFGRDGTRVISVSDDGAVSLWDAAAKNEVRRIRHRVARPISAVGFDLAGKFVAAADENNTLRLWDAATGARIRRTETAHKGSIYAIAFSRDSELVASAGDGGIVMLWRTADLRLVRRFTASRDAILSLDVSPDGKTICMGGVESVLGIYDLAGGEIYRSQAFVKSEEHVIRRVAFSPDGRLIAWAGEDRIVRLLDAQKHLTIAELGGHQGDVNQVAFSRRSHLIASASDDGTILVWDVTRVFR
jgi:WD40 repeat protein